MIKQLARCIREYLPATLLSPLCMIGEVYMEVQIPLVLSRIVDLGVQVGNMSAVWKYGFQLMLYALISLIFGVASAFLASYAATGFSRNLRHDMYYKVQTFDFSNIDKFSTSSIVTRLTSDVANIQMSFQMMIRMAIRCPMMLILATVNAFSISPKLCVVYCVILPLLGLGLYLIMKSVLPIFDRVFKTYDKLNNVVQENIHGIRVVKSFVREDRETEKFSTVSGEIYKDFCKAERTMAFGNPLMQLVVYICIITISYLGATMIVQSGNNEAMGLTTGQLTSMFTYTSQILNSLMMLSMVFVMLTMSRAPMRRTTEILAEEPALHNPSNPVTEVKDGSIDFDSVTFRYSAAADRDSLESINLHIKPGQTVGILGGTGSGKSTLVQLIPRLYDATEGSIRVGGVDVRDYDVTALRDSVSMVLQKNVLFSGTIKDNLRWGNPNASDEEMVHACRLACADDFIQSFPDKYDTHIEQGGTNVSGGQKQRLCIARALLKKPKILILDDSTSAVDTHTDAMIRKAFAEEIPDTTKLIIAQRVASVENADLILVMDGGRIVAQGTHDELLKNSPIYQEVYRSQTKGGRA
ncbi:MAG: ABC transporter ATP-binding protein/permease [Clostridiales bacterium]|nr:ABC transporter ATP-binding protein/permease [Clostridiales bacterium]MDD7386440.1 ABC transporter ATP-binding protein [Bacillota bacterium]